MDMSKDNFIILQKNERRNLTLLVKKDAEKSPTKQDMFIVAYNLIDNGTTYDWYNGHYFDSNLFEAIMYLYKEDVIEHFNLKENINILNEMETKNLYNNEQIALADIIGFINDIMNDTIYSKIVEVQERQRLWK